MTTTDTAPVTQAELLPCPFCGGPAGICGFESSWYIRCTTDDCWCADHAQLWGELDEGITVWNTRLATESRIAANEGREVTDWEAAAWQWLDNRGVGLDPACDPNDRDYGTDDMVDSFIGGAEAALAQPRPAVDREAVARIIDPVAFRNLEALYEYCLVCGDSEADARKVADDTHLPDCANALAKADAILALSPPAAKVEDYTRQRVAEVMEDGGFWLACSGCQESSDGCVSTTDYPYSPTFKCQPGGGCSECGGIGVIWDDGRGYENISAAQGDAAGEGR